MSRNQRLAWAQGNAGILTKIAGIRHCSSAFVSQIFHGERGWDKQLRRFHSEKAAKISASIDKAILASRGETAPAASAGDASEGGAADAEADSNLRQAALALVPEPSKSQLSLRLDGDGVNVAFKREPGKVNSVFTETLMQMGLTMRDVASAGKVNLATVWTFCQGETVSPDADQKIRNAVRRLSSEKITINARVMERI